MSSMFAFVPVQSFNAVFMVLLLYIISFVFSFSMPLWLMASMCLAYFMQRYGALYETFVESSVECAEAKEELAQGEFMLKVLFFCQCLKSRELVITCHEDSF